MLIYIVYTKQGENHGTMILHGASYSAYTVVYVGSYQLCRVIPVM